MEKIKRALEAVQHIYLCEDEGMASGQPTKEDYLEARKLVAAALSALEGSQPKAPPRYVRSGPPVQMQDVLLACGELNVRERVAVQWVLDKINELPEHPKEQGEEPVAWIGPHKTAWDALNDLRRTVAEMIGTDPDTWPEHGNAGLAIAAALKLGELSHPTAREKAMEEAECTFYRDGDRIVQRLRGRDEFGEPQVTEQYIPVEAAIAMHKELGTALLSERSKPSLMVGFSEEEIEQAGVDAYPYDRPGAHFKKGQAHRRMGFKKGLRYANARAVSIDKIMEVVREATWINDVDLLRERLTKIAALP